jgi:multiple sugar transport system substrate-binding protein
MTSLKRTARTLLSATALAVIGLGTMSFAVQSKEVLVWWDYLTGGDGVRMKQLIADFNAAHEGEIEIQPTTLEWGTPYYTKLQTSAMVGEASDIAVYPLSRMPGAVMSGTLSPLDPVELEKVGITPDDYIASNLEAAKVDGQQYVAPLDIHAFILFYNKQKLADVGLLGEDGKPKGLDGLENFNAALKKLKDAGATYPLTYRTSDGDAIWRFGYSLFGQQNGVFIEDGKVLPGDNLDKAVKATDTIKGWLADGLLSPNIQGAAALALWQSQEVPLFVTGVWQTGSLEDLQKKGELFDWGAVELPVLFDRPAAWTDSQGLAIPNNAGKEMTAERKAAIYEAIGWISEHSLLWGAAGYLPAFKPVLDSAEFQAMKHQQIYRSFAEHAFYDPQNAISGPASTTWDIVANYALPATYGEMDTTEAWTNIRDEVQAALDEQ